MSDELCHSPSPDTWTITLRKTGVNIYAVVWGEAHLDGLTWDEMLGQLAYMTMPVRERARVGGLPSLFQPRKAGALPEEPI